MCVEGHYANAKEQATCLIDIIRVVLYFSFLVREHMGAQLIENLVNL